METTNLRCWGHREEDANWNCGPEICSVFSAAQVLEDRVAAIQHLAERAREDLDNNAEPLLPITAVLEAIRVLARSISDAGSLDSPLIRAGSDTLRWTVLRLAEAPRLRSLKAGR